MAVFLKSQALSVHCLSAIGNNYLYKVFEIEWHVKLPLHLHLKHLFPCEVQGPCGEQSLTVNLVTSQSNNRTSQ